MKVLPIELSDDILSHFYEGDCEIRNYNLPRVYHGRIGIICLQGNNILVEFDWFAKGDDFPPIPKSWEKTQETERLFDLDFYNISKDKEGVFFLKHKVINETVILTPKGMNVVHPIQVKGLAALQGF